MVKKKKKKKKKSGLNLLHQACGANQLEVVKVLLSKDIDVNLVTSPVKLLTIENL